MHEASSLCDGELKTFFFRNSPTRQSPRLHSSPTKMFQKVLSPTAAEAPFSGSSNHNSPIGHSPKFQLKQSDSSHASRRTSNITCRKAKVPEDQKCESCRHTKLKRKCFYARTVIQMKRKDILMCPRPPSNQAELNSVKKCPVKFKLEKGNKREYWSEFMAKCMEEEQKYRVKCSGWWHKFDRK